jgi:hypothetical protein
MNHEIQLSLQTVFIVNVKQYTILHAFLNQTYRVTGELDN